MSRPALKITAGIVLGLLVLLIAVRLSLPWAMKSAFHEFFDGQGVTAELGDVDLEIVDGRLMLGAISAERDGQRVLALRSLHLDWSWSDVFDRNGRVLDFRIDGLELITRQQDEDSLVIAGIDLSQLGGDNGQTDTRDESAQASTEPSQWQAQLERVKLSDSRLCYSSYQSEQMDLCTRFDRIEWDGTIGFDLSRLTPEVVPLTADGVFEIDNIELENRHHKLVLLELDSLMIGGIKLNTLQDINIDRLALNGLARACVGTDVFALPDYCLHAKRIEWNGKVHTEVLAGAGKLPVAASGSLGIDALHVEDLKQKLTALELASLELDALALESLDNIRFERVLITEPKLLQRNAKDGAKHITAFASLSLDGFRLDNMNSLSVDQLTISGHSLQLVKQQDGEFEFSAWLPASPDAEQAAGNGAAEPEQASSFQYRIGKLVYSTDQAIVYTDLSLPEPFTLIVNKLDLSLQNLDSRKPDQASALKLSAVVYEHGKLNFEGTATPLASERSLDIDGNISGLDLRKLSAFTRGTIGYSIKSGQLDSNIDLKATNDILDSKLKLELNQLQLKALSKQDAEKMEKNMGFPLNTSLALLRDRDNSIRLEIPIEGDLDKPDFSLVDVINKATSKAITTAVINYYTPYGLVMAAEGLFSLATRLRFDPVEYEAGDSALPDAARDRLGKGVKLLQDRPGIFLTLCGFTTLADAAKLVPDREADRDGKLPALTDDQRQQLLDLGEARAAAVKSHLVDAGIAADRLILCEPEHEDEDKPGRVEISI